MKGAYNNYFKNFLIDSCSLFKESHLRERKTIRKLPVAYTFLFLRCELISHYKKQAGQSVHYDIKCGEQRRVIP